jgi:cell division septum initiation protein DivIVA
LSIYNKIDEIGEYIQKAKLVPVLNQKLLDVNYLMRALEELYAAIPAEIKEANESIKAIKEQEIKVKAESENMLERTRQECEKMIQMARMEAQRLINEDEIKAEALEHAKSVHGQVMAQIEEMKSQSLAEVEHIRKETLEKARDFEERAYDKARQIKHNADRYAEEVLSHIDSSIAELQAVSRSTRRFMVEHSEKDILQKAHLN